MKKNGLFLLLLSQLLVIVGFWAWDQIQPPLGNLLVGGVAGQYLAFGRLAGLLAFFFILLQLLMVGRVPWVEKRFGLDQLTRLHHGVGFFLAAVLVLHPLLVTIGHAKKADVGVGVLDQFLDFCKNWDDILPAVMGFGLLIAAVIASGAVIRKRVSFEVWHASHYFLYLAIALLFGHQIVIGGDFTGNDGFLIYWISLCLFILGTLLVCRIGRPLWNYRCHRFRVARLVPEASDVTSIYIKGRAMGQFRANGGQFVFVRFWAPGFRWQVHPFSISCPPDGLQIRLTIKQLGDFTRQIPHLAPGTPVILDGPYGTFTASRAVSPKVLLIAGGIGITPIRAMLDGLLADGRNLVLLYANRNTAGVVFRTEIDDLSAAFPGRFRVVYVMSHDPEWEGEKGILDRDRLTRLVPDLKERDAFLCGPPPMMNSLRPILKSQGVRYIYSERFSL
ncbi:MAG: ferredoxin reductase family protein [bacterium]